MNGRRLIRFDDKERKDARNEAEIEDEEEDRSCDMI